MEESFVPIENEASQAYSHVTFESGRIRKWGLRSNRASDFWYNYSEIVAKNTEEGYPPERLTNLPAIGEKAHEEFNPLIVDLFLHFAAEENVHDDELEDGFSVEHNFLLAIIHYTQMAMAHTLQLPETAHQVICLLLQSVKPWLSTFSGIKTVCTGYRFVYPLCRCDSNAQRRIREALIHSIRITNIGHFIFPQAIGDWDVQIELPVAKGYVTMYGSVDPRQQMPFELTQIYPLVTQEHFESGQAPQLSLDMLTREELTEGGLQHPIAPMDPGLHCDVRDGLIDAPLVTQENRQFWLPLICSLRYCSAPTLLRSEQPAASAPQRTKTPRPGHTEGDTPLKTGKLLLRLLNPARFDDYIYWRDIGSFFYTATDGAPEGLDEWCKFTHNHCKRFQPGDCKARYGLFRNSLITYRTVAHYARLDNPVAFGKWQTSWEESALAEASFRGTEGACARALYRMKWLDYVCTNVEKNHWKRYEKHHWVDSDAAKDLRLLVTGQFRNYFEKMHAQLSTANANLVGTDSSTEVRKAMNRESMKRLDRLITRLDGTSFGSNIARQAALLFHDEAFDTNHDENPLLMATGSCVIECIEGSRRLVSGEEIPEVIRTRPGKPEDYVTRTTITPYNTSLTWESEPVKFIVNWARQTFAVDQTIVHEFFKKLAALLKGRNAEKAFDVMTGEGGDNAKSMWMELLLQTLGPLAVKMNVSSITGRSRNGGSGPSPDMARCRGARLVIIDEPDGEEVLMAAIIKLLTGNDKFYARLLHENGGDIRALFKVFLICNIIPVIPNAGRPMRKRLWAWPYESTWTADAPDDPAAQFAKRMFKDDPHFDEKIPELTEALLWIMVQYYPLYRKEGIHRVGRCKEMTDQYWADNDDFEKFEREQTLPAEGAKLATDMLYRTFRAWFASNNPRRLCPNETITRREFNHRWGRHDEELNWSGRRLKMTMGLA